LQLLYAIDELYLPAVIGPDEMGDGLDDINPMID